MKNIEFDELIDLASDRFGGSVLYANDDFFASKDNLVKASTPIFLEHEYTDRGKWMDGWESRRRRTPGFDWCIVRLGLPGRISRFIIDTSYFRGNYPEECSIEACSMEGNVAVEDVLSDSTRWSNVLSQSRLAGDSLNEFDALPFENATHLRFRIYPDGGVARLRAFGMVSPNPERMRGKVFDLAAAENGGAVIDCSDKFFGHPLNLIMPGRAVNMSDGWETKRRRGPGHDWVILRLAGVSRVHSLEIDTNHFKGNYPDTCSIEQCSLAEGVPASGVRWVTLLDRVKLQPHFRHFYDSELHGGEAVTHLRLNVYPDGGVSRWRVYGELV